MGGGASLVNYDDAYRQVRHRGKGLFGAATVASMGAVGVREASAEASAEAAPAEREPDKMERTREVSDLMWRMNDYRTIDCECGTRLRVPPKLRAKNIRCPHCGRAHPVP